MVAVVTEFGYCHCGCGGKTRIAPVTRRHLGHKRGEPLRYINGHNAKGRTLSEETKARVGASHFAERSVDWKGENVSYNALHHWMRRHFPKSGVCEHCHAERRTHWANVDHAYRRVREDWIELCCSCHTRFDGRGFKRKVA